jgi:serine/threonine protein kinase
MAIKHCDNTDCKREAELMSKIQQASLSSSEQPIVQIVCLLPKENAYAMNLVEGTALSEETPHLASYSESRFRLMIAQMVSALGFLHSNGIIHLDPQSSNYVVNPATEKVVLIDFSGSLSIGELQQFPLYSLAAPPEIRPKFKGFDPEGEGRIVKPRSDVWILGSTIYALQTAHKTKGLYGSLHEVIPLNAQAFGVARDVALEEFLVSNRVYFDSKLFSPELQDLLEHMLETDYSKRYQDMGQVLDHPYFAEVDFSRLPWQNNKGEGTLGKKSNTGMTHFHGMTYAFALALFHFLFL